MFRKVGRNSEVENATKTARRDSGKAPRRPFTGAEETERAERFKRLLPILIAGAIAFGGSYGLLYSQTGAWQLLAQIGVIVAGLVLAFVAYVLAQRGRFDVAGLMIVCGLAATQSSAEMFFDKATLSITIGGALLILLAGRAVLPRKWTTWLIVVGLFGLSVLLINLYEPVPRYEVERATLMNALTGLLALGLLWEVVRVFNTRTIRTRLLIASIVTISLTAAAISAGSIVNGFRFGRQQVTRQLESVTALKEAEIKRWIQNVKDGLSGPLQQPPEHRFAEPEMAKVVTTMVDTSPDSEEYQNAKTFLTYNFDQWLKRTQLFETVFLMNREGEVILATDPAMEGQDLAHEDYFEQGSRLSYVSPPRYSSSLSGVSIVAARPVLGEYGRLLGVLAGRASIGALSEIMLERTGLGETGETYLVDLNHTLLTGSRFSEAGDLVRSQGADAAIEDHLSGSGVYDGYRGVSVVGVYHWLPDLQVALLAEQEAAEAFSVVNRTAWLNARLALVFVVLGAGVSLLIARSIGDPLSDLAETASQIAGGDLDRATKVERRDEIGMLAQAFNSMTTQLRELIGSLEQRVAERTRDLELRSAYLEASAEVGRAVSSILDADALTQKVVDLIRKRFGLYYVGLFLVDETGEWAVLKAGTGRAGQEMLAQGHKLAVGGDSMIGQCVDQARARISLDVGEEAVRFDNPHLPKTRSEAALPLQSRGRTLGAVTIQSDQPAAFDEDILNVLQTMVDQVAVALDNAYLFAESQANLEAARRAYSRLSREAWARLLRARRSLSYRSDEHGVTRAEGEVIQRPEIERALRQGKTVEGESSGTRQIESQSSPGDGGGQPLAVPIKVRGNVIGALSTHKPNGAGAWTQEQIETLETLADQLGLALESARLHEDTQRRAAREQMLSEVTARFAQSLDFDAVLQVAARELGQLPKVAEASVHVGLSKADGSEGARDAKAQQERNAP